MLAQGNALGFGTHQDVVRPEGAQESPRPFRASDDSLARSRGDAPGWHPPRRWRDSVATHDSITQATWVIEFASRMECPSETKSNSEDQKPIEERHRNV